MENKDVDFDPFCDPDNPRTIKYESILAASKRIEGYVLRTPCTRANMSEMLGMDVYLKQECMQITGSLKDHWENITRAFSFKERGVVNTLLLLPDEQKKLGVITASMGNQGQAVSYHATQFGMPSIVVMPVYAPLTKVTKCTGYGAKTILHGNGMPEAKHHAMVIRSENGMLYINGYDHPNIIEGQGTLALEILEQVPDVDAILVPVGGGSLVAGVCVAVKHLKPDTEVYGIETDKTCSMTESLRRGERTKIEIDYSLADGLAVNLVGVNTFHNIKDKVNKMVAVKEDWVARAIMHIAEEERFVVEGAGAVPIAAIMAGLFPNLQGKKVVCVLTGGNMDTTTLARCLERGMAAEGRLVKFKVTVSDRPGGMAELCSLLSRIGVTLRDCIPERAWIHGDVFSVEVKVIAETKGSAHAKELVAQIKKNYKNCFFPDFDTDQKKASCRGATRRGPCLAPNPTCVRKRI